MYISKVHVTHEKRQDIQSKNHALSKRLTSPAASCYREAHERDRETKLVTKTETISVLSGHKKAHQLTL